MTDRDLAKVAWRKSSRSGAQGNCVEVAGSLPGIVAVRDSRNPGGPPLRFAHGMWDTFTSKVKKGEYDQQ